MNAPDDGDTDVDVCNLLFMTLKQDNGDDVLLILMTISMPIATLNCLHGDDVAAAVADPVDAPCVAELCSTGWCCG